MMVFYFLANSLDNMKCQWKQAKQGLTQSCQGAVWLIKPRHEGMRGNKTGQTLTFSKCVLHSQSTYNFLNGTLPQWPCLVISQHWDASSHHYNIAVRQQWVSPHCISLRLYRVLWRLFNTHIYCIFLFWHHSTHTLSPPKNHMHLPQLSHLTCYLFHTCQTPSAGLGL